MYKWKIVITLKSGKEITAYTANDCRDSTAVANKYFAGATNEYVGFLNENGTENILVMKSEIAAISISVSML